MSRKKSMKEQIDDLEEKLAYAKSLYESATVKTLDYNTIIPPSIQFYKDKIKKLEDEIFDLTDKHASAKIINDLKSQLKKKDIEIHELKSQVKTLDEKLMKKIINNKKPEPVIYQTEFEQMAINIKELEEKLKIEQEKHSRKGTGRKRTKGIKDHTIIQLRASGKTIREINAETGLSTATINRILKQNKLMTNTTG